jgi:hypothetical protein
MKNKANNILNLTNNVKLQLTDFVYDNNRIPIDKLYVDDKEINYKYTKKYAYDILINSLNSYKSKRSNNLVKLFKSYRYGMSYFDFTDKNILKSAIARYFKDNFSHTISYSDIFKLELLLVPDRSHSYDDSCIRIDLNDMSYTCKKISHYRIYEFAYCYWTIKHYLDLKESKVLNKLIEFFKFTKDKKTIWFIYENGTKIRMNHFSLVRVLDSSNFYQEKSPIKLKHGKKIIDLSLLNTLYHL